MRIMLYVVVLLMLGSCDPHKHGTCHTDTECMQMHGGDGGPES